MALNDFLILQIKLLTKGLVLVSHWCLPVLIAFLGAWVECCFLLAHIPPEQQLLVSMATASAPSLGSHPLPMGFPIALGHFSLHSLPTFDSLLSKKPSFMKQAQKLLLTAKLHPGSTLAFLGFWFKIPHGPFSIV